jgi:UDP-glucose 4-epimerase
MPFDMKRFVVTGGSGFLGSRLVHRLRKEGGQVTAVSNDGAVDCVCSDLARPGVLDELLSEDTTVFHLAGSVDVRASVADPWFDLSNNFLATFQVLESARRRRSRVLFTSSACVLDDSNPLPFREHGLFRPSSPYGAAKLASESYCFAFHRSYGLDTRIARITNFYGPGMRRFVIADLVRKMQANPEQITIFGDGSQIRDYLYVDDAVEALLVIASRGCPGADYNVGSGEPVRIIELVHKIATILGCPEIRVDSEPTTPGDVPSLWVDTSKLRSLGFEPRVSLDAGLRATIESLCKVEQPA